MVVAKKLGDENVNIRIWVHHVDMLCGNVNINDWEFGVVLFR